MNAIKRANIVMMFPFHWACLQIIYLYIGAATLSYRFIACRHGVSASSIWVSVSSECSSIICRIQNKNCLIFCWLWISQANTLITINLCCVKGKKARSHHRRLFFRSISNKQKNAEIFWWRFQSKCHKVVPVCGQNTTKKLIHGNTD